MDQLQRAGADHDRLAGGAHDGGRGDQPGAKACNEFTTADGSDHGRLAPVWLAWKTSNKHAA